MSGEGSRASSVGEPADDLHDHDVRTVHAERLVVLKQKTAALNRAARRAVRKAGKATLAAVRYALTIESDDPARTRLGSLPTAVAVAMGAGVVELFPAWLGAQALGWGIVATLITTVLFATGLSLTAWLLSHCRHEERGGLFMLMFAIGIAMVGILSYLRFDYARIVGGASLWRALVEAALLALVTVSLAVASFVMLDRAESVSHFKLRRARDDSRAEAEAALGELEASIASTENEVDVVRTLGTGSFKPVPALNEDLERAVTEAIDQIDKARGDLVAANAGLNGGGES